MKKVILSLLLSLIFILPAYAQPGAGGIIYDTVERDVDRKLRVSSMSYLYDIAEGSITGHVGLSKFGHGSDSDTGEEIWDANATVNAAYDYLADDTFATMYISSDDGGDTDIDYNVQGLDSEYNHASVTCTTDASDGNTFVACNSGSSGADANKWWRIYRVLCAEATTDPNTNNCATGDIYISKDNTDAGGNGVPDTATDIQAMVNATYRQTNMALYSVPTGKTFYLTHAWIGNLSNTTIHVAIFIREFGSARLSKRILVLPANGGMSNISQWDVPLSVPAKSDVSMIMTESAAGNADITAGFEGWYE